MKQEQPPPAAAVVRPGWVFRVAVCLVSGAYGTFFALLSALLYILEFVMRRSLVRPAEYGLAAIVFGPVAGTMAGVVWCLLMDDRAPGSEAQLGKFLRVGAGRGTLVGLGAAELIHGGLMFLRGGFEGGMLLVGAVSGLVAGAFLGMILGALWYPAQRWRQRRLSKPQAQPSAPDNPPGGTSE